jgi:amino acid transporter
MLLWRGGRRLSLALFTQLPPAPLEQGGGFGNAIVGTLIIVTLAVLTTVPIGLLTAIYLAEARDSRLSGVVRFFVKVLTGFPSILAGVFAYGTIVLATGGFSAFAGAVALSILMLPTIILTSEDAIRMVPGRMKDAAIGMGATSTQTVARVRALASGQPHCAVCCDSGRSFRKDISADYKATRPESDATLQHQITLAMGVYRALPTQFAKMHPKFKTPHISTMLTGLVIIIVAAFTPIGVLEEMVNIGTLLAFVIVCGAVLLLRIRRPEATRPFRCPALFLVAPLGILVNVIMMLFLPIETWGRLVIWLVIGLVIYFTYGYWRSSLGKAIAAGRA